MKNQENQPLDNLFRSLNDSEVAPPSASWAQMEALLDAQDGKKKRGFIWYWVAAAVLPFMLVAGWFWFPQKTEMALVLPEKPITENSVSPTQTAEATDKSKESFVASSQPVSQNMVATRVVESNPIVTKRSTSSNQLPDRKMEQAKEESVAEVNLNQIESPISIPGAEPELLAQPEAHKADLDQNMASIEFRPGKTEDESEEIASIEWKKETSGREKFKNAVEKIRSGNFDNVPSLGQAKENLFAFITHPKN